MVRTCILQFRKVGYHYYKRISKCFLLYFHIWSSVFVFRIYFISEQFCLEKTRDKIQKGSIDEYFIALAFNIFNYYRNNWSIIISHLSRFIHRCFTYLCGGSIILILFRNSYRYNFDLFSTNPSKRTIKD